MPFRHVDKGIKQRAVALLARGTWTHSEIADILGVSLRSVYRWAENDLLYNDVIPPRRALRGRPRILSGQDLHAVLELLEQAPEAYLREVKSWICYGHSDCLRNPSP